MQSKERVVLRDGEIGGWSTWTIGVAHRDCLFCDKQRCKRVGESQCHKSSRSVAPIDAPALPGHSDGLATNEGKRKEKKENFALRALVIQTIHASNFWEDVLASAHQTVPSKPRSVGLPHQRENLNSELDDSS
ncbi:hypothetical protein INR49_009189 [Caranx melampygus]|nr:hypothetical protein INR49_009189 [Caranx melampygus]